MSDKQIEFTIIVNGQPVPVKIDLYAEIGEAVAQALDKSGNSGQPIENWELRGRLWPSHRHGAENR